MFQIDGGSEQLTRTYACNLDLRASVQYISCTNVCTFGFLHLSHFIHSLTKRLHIAVSTYESFPHSLTLFILLIRIRNRIQRKRHFGFNQFNWDLILCLEVLMFNLEQIGMCNYQINYKVTEAVIIKL